MNPVIKRGIFDMTLAMVMSGTIGWFVLQSGQSPYNVVFFRCLIGAPVLALLCYHLKAFSNSGLDAKRILIAAGGGVALVMNWLLLFSAYPLASISVTTIVYNFQPFMLVGLGALFLGERVSGTKLGWMGLAFTGMLAMTLSGAPIGGQAGLGYVTGILLSLGAAFCYAVAAFVTRQLRGTSPYVIALIQVLTGIVILLPFADFNALPSSPQSWAMVATIGVVHTGAMYAFLYSAIQKLPVIMTGTLSFLYPVVAIVVDMLAYGHVLTPGQALGGAAILLAAVGTTLNLTPRHLLPRHRKA
ncbi:DMT family transporter [Rhizobium rhizophilum]|uniref:DMT family transporter n=1 Tax=Rhizobium rhizophilum TaxID=1850373 RepID=A0ABY2R189_9HYPH|nr:DMT family transporter [Rhizobium rhizophilum]THV17286.1 DMT family transporter [Rhizobium rhizophilum]